MRQSTLHSRRGSKAGVTETTRRLCPECTKNVLKANTAGELLQCSLLFGCGKKAPRKEFSKTQRDKGENRICPECAAGKTLLQCGKCKATWSRRCFAPAELKHGRSRQCKDCKQCGRCQRYSPSASFEQCVTQTPSYMKTFQKRRCNDCR